MPEMPSLPPGFTLDQPKEALPPLPPGFALDAPTTPAAGTSPTRGVGFRDFLPSGATINQFFYGANERLADVVALPGDLASATLKVLRVPGRHEPTDDYVTQFLRKGGAENPPQTRAGRIFRRAGEEVGATLPFAALPFVAPATRIVGPAKSLIGGAVRTLTEGVQRAAGRAATGEAVATVGSGTGAGIAEEIFPGSMFAETTGQLAGGVAPTALTFTPLVLAARLARMAVKRVSPSMQTAAARREVGRVIGDELGPEAQAGLREAETLSREVPGFDPTLAERTGSPGLIATQRQIESQASGRELEVFQGRRAASEEAIERFALTKAPEFGASAEFIVDTANGRITQLRTLGRAAQDQVGRRQADLTARLPQANRSAAGVTLREGLQTRRQVVRQDMNRLADELGINDVDITVEWARTRAAIHAEFKQQSIFEDAKNFPEVLRLIKPRPSLTAHDRFKAGLPLKQQRDRITFRDIKALRERLTDDLLDAQSSATPSRKKVRQLTLLKQRVAGFLDELADQAGDPGLAGRYREFRATYKAEYIDRFEEGAAFKVRRRDGRGFFKTSDEQVASVFFAPGDVSAARQFKRVFGGDPAANDALGAVALDSLRDAAVRDGSLKPSLLEGWTRRHRSVLDEFPAIRSAVSDIELASRNIEFRQAQLVARTRAIEDQALVKQLVSFERGAKTPEEVITSALNDPRKMSQLVKSVGLNSEVHGTLKRHVWDRVAGGTSREIADFISRHPESLRRALGSRHLKALDTIMRARAILERVPASAGRGFDPNPLAKLEREIGMGVAQISSRVFAAQSGRVGARFLAIDAFSRFIRGRSLLESQALLKEALYDPKVARELASLVAVKSNLPAAKRLNVRLFNLGLSSREREFEESTGRPLQDVVR